MYEIINTLTFVLMTIGAALVIDLARLILSYDKYLSSSESE